MHSRILSIIEKTSGSEYEEERDRAMSLTDEEIMEQMCGVPDYVCERDEIEEDIEWFLMGKDYFEQTGDNTFKVNKDKLEEYFRDKIEHIRSVVYGWTDVKQMIMSIGRLNEHINDRFGFYVAYGWYTETLDDFLREIYIADNYDREYEIVRAFDYHF